jgi:hypothetical protein
MNETANMRALNMRRPGAMEMEEEVMLPPELYSPQPGMMDPGTMQPMDPNMMQPQPDEMAGRVFTPGVGWKKLPTS